MFEFFSSILKPIWILFFFSLPIFAIWGPIGFSRPMAPCAPTVLGGDLCTVGVLELHPTQLSIGGIEVDLRAENFRKLSANGRQKAIEKHVLPVILGPGNLFYLIDHHHFTAAVAQVLGNRAQLIGKVLHNWSQKTNADFWESMIQGEYVYLIDENGNGPLPYESLTRYVFDLKNDPLRSLAWGVSKNGGYDETDVSHADFLWAQYFRPNFPADFVTSSFEQAVRDATIAAMLPEASGLPGYHR